MVRKGEDQKIPCSRQIPLSRSRKTHALKAPDFALSLPPEGDVQGGVAFLGGGVEIQAEGVPADAFGAFGNRGQYLVVIPSRELVIVRRGYDSPGDPFDVAKFTAAVVAALP